LSILKSRKAGYNLLGNIAVLGNNTKLF